MSDKTPSGWKLLHDVQWMNIVNHDHAHQSASKDEAINTVFKMTEAKVREVNEPLMAEMLGLLVESQESIGGNWRERRDAAVAKALG